jgi:hypothetical protein
LTNDLLPPGCLIDRCSVCRSVLSVFYKSDLEESGMKKRFSVLLAVLVVLSMVLSACGGAAPAAAPQAGSEGRRPNDRRSGHRRVLAVGCQPAPGLPGVRRCVHGGEPEHQVNITQSGWDDYWNGIQTGMVAGTAPDVFTNHLAKYPEFAAKEQLVDIEPLRAARRRRSSVSTWVGWPTCGRAMASASACPRTGTPLPSSTNKDAIEAAGSDTRTRSTRPPGTQRMAAPSRS